jgi:hypothetical protein
MPRPMRGGRGTRQKPLREPTGKNECDRVRRAAGDVRGGATCSTCTWWDGNRKKDISAAPARFDGRDPVLVVAEHHAAAA